MKNGNTIKKSKKSLSAILLSLAFLILPYSAQGVDEPVDTQKTVELLVYAGDMFPDEENDLMATLNEESIDYFVGHLKTTERQLARARAMYFLARKYSEHKETLSDDQKNEINDIVFAAINRHPDMLIMDYNRESLVRFDRERVRDCLEQLNTTANPELREAIVKTQVLLKAQQSTEAGESNEKPALWPWLSLGGALLAILAIALTRRCKKA